MVIGALTKLPDLKSVTKLGSLESDLLGGSYKLQLIRKAFEKFDCLMEG